MDGWTEGWNMHMFVNVFVSIYNDKRTHSPIAITQERFSKSEEATKMQLLLEANLSLTRKAYGMPIVYINGNVVEVKSWR